MKKLSGRIGLFLLITISILTFSCSDGNSSEKATSTEAHGTNAAYTSAYVCPMHCKDSGSDKAGTCPVCGMDYIAQKEHTKDGHKH